MHKRDKDQLFVICIMFLGLLLVFFFLFLSRNNVFFYQNLKVSYHGLSAYLYIEVYSVIFLITVPLSLFLFCFVIKTKEDFTRMLNFLMSCATIGICLLKQLFEPSMISAAPLFMLFVILLVHFIFFDTTLGAALTALNALIAMLFLLVFPHVTTCVKYRPRRVEEPSVNDKGEDQFITVLMTMLSLIVMTFVNRMLGDRNSNDNNKFDEGQDFINKGGSFGRPQ